MVNSSTGPFFVVLFAIALVALVVVATFGPMLANAIHFVPR